MGFFSFPAKIFKLERGKMENKGTNLNLAPFKKEGKTQLFKKKMVKFF